MELIKVKLFRFFVTQMLKMMGNKKPDFLLSLFSDLNLSKRQEQILNYRYIQRLKFDSIYSLVNCEERYVYKLHQEAIDKLVVFVIAYKIKT